MVRATRILVVVLAGLVLAGAGTSWAQDTPAAQDKDKATAQDKDKTQDKDKKEAATVDPISGDWEGSVETPNGTINFILTVKVDKDKVSGQIGSSEGTVPLTGTWVESKLSATFDYNGTPITMSGTVKDGALGGDMNYGTSGTVMPYTAKRKKS